MCEAATVQHERASKSMSSSAELHFANESAQRELVAQHKHASEQKSKRRRISELSDHARRSYNRQHMLVVDAELRLAGVPLSRMFAQEGLRATPLDMSRRDHLEGELCGYEIVDSGGAIVHSVSLSEDAYTSRFVWHVCQDQGPKGLSAGAFMSHIGVRGSFEFDPIHRLHNDWSMAMSRAGLAPLRALMRRMLSVRNGPFRSQAQHGLLKQC
eukprot:6486857-Amphidinium_carterae.1